MSTEAKRGRPTGGRFTHAVDLRLPPEMGAAVNEVAHNKFTTPAQFIRDAIREKLESGGICLVPSKAA